MANNAVFRSGQWSTAPATAGIVGRTGCETGVATTTSRPDALVEVTREVFFSLEHIVVGSPPVSDQSLLPRFPNTER